MLDDDQDAVAAEYVLGTLSDEERTHAEALLAVDPEFEMAVRHWERRLGELNVMVEAVEPPAEVWDRIKTEIGSVAAESTTHESVTDETPTEEHAEAVDSDETLPPAPMLDDIFEPVAGHEAHEEHELPVFAEEPHDAETPPPPPPGAGKIERSADVIYLAGRVSRWRGVAYGLGAIAAVLAIYVAVGQLAPGLIPRPGAGPGPARPETAARPQTDRLVAVLQQGPTAPAFLLTVDTQSRTLTVRAVSARPEAGKSYELWLVSNGAARSLGLIGSDEFTQSKIAGNYDADTLRTATYAVSLEPTGGSKGNGPSGPILFTGKAIESLPAAPPPTPKT